MGKLIDLTGQKFGKLTVITLAYTKNKKSYWLCKCDCGNETIVRSDTLKSGTTQSCGCYHKDCAREQGMKSFDNLTGKKFGRLLVIKRVSEIGEKPVLYECLCDCGNIHVSRASLLRDGTTKSCGCYNKELVIKRNKDRIGIKIGRYKENKYEYFDTYVVGYDSNGKPYYVDLDDFNKIKDYTWYVNSDNYVTCLNENIYMHNLILPCENGYMPDHKHGKASRNDNRKYNLRIVTNAQNCHNRDKGTNNTSGFIGVCYRKDRNKYYVYIGINNKDVHIGGFDDFTEAVKARILSEIEHYGEYMYQPHLRVLDYINSGGKLEYGDKETINNIMNGEE